MNHNTLPANGPERKLAYQQDLVVLRDRIDAFVQLHGPTPPIPEGTLVYSSGLEPARPLVTESTDDIAVNLIFSGEFLAEIAPEAAEYLEASQISFSRDVPTYQYKHDSLPADTASVSNEDIFDRHWHYGCSSILVEKKPEARFAATFYSLSFKGGMGRSSDPGSERPFPMSSEDPMTISQQELDAFNAILDALDALSPEQRTQYMEATIG